MRIYSREDPKGWLRPANGQSTVYDGRLHQYQSYGYADGVVTAILLLLLVLLGSGVRNSMDCIGPKDCP